MSRQCKLLAMGLYPRDRAVAAQPLPGAAAEQAPDDVRPAGSRAIEQDADVIMFVLPRRGLPPGYQSYRGVAELIIAKHRNGSAKHCSVCVPG